MTVRLFNRLLAIALLIIAFASCSDSAKEDLEPNVPTESTIKVHVENAGNLSSLLNVELKNIKDLAISGKLNGDDITILRAMYKTLVTLDLSEAQIVEGGGYYLYNPYPLSGMEQKYYTINNIFPSFGMDNFFELQEIKLPKTVTKIDDFAFFSCKKLKTIEIPQNVYNLGRNVFQGCESLEKISLSSNLKLIPIQTFQGCLNLKEITLPEKIDSIGSSAFSGCNSLEKLHIKSENPPVTGSWFKEDCENCTLYIPQGCKTTYINAGEPWTLFKDIIEE